MCFIAHYLKQRNGLNYVGHDMSDFVSDVKQIEKYIGGNINIFDQFIEKKQTEEEKKQSLQTIKKSFITNKERKRRENKKRYEPLTTLLHGISHLL